MRRGYPAWEYEPTCCRQAQRGPSVSERRGKRREFDLHLAAEGPDFHQQVWAALLEIPYGETTSYGALAKKLGVPGAARAVGVANGANPIGLVVPCHRVIGSDGSLTGYGVGLPLKRALLEHEAQVAGRPFDLFA